MSKKKEPTLIDGFASVQAIKRSGKSPQEQPKLRHSATRLPLAEAPPSADATPPGSPRASRIGHTAVPAKHDMVCYECEYAFTVSGKVHYTFCPKCKRNLDMSDHVISAEWTIDLRTMGTIEIKPDALLGPVTLVAQNIIVAGDATRATLRCTRRLDMADGGGVTLSRVTFKEFCVRPGGAFSFADPIDCRVIDIAGKLRANLHAEDRVIIRATGDYRGELYSPRLQVEDGAAIHAAMYLGVNLAKAAGVTQHAA
ncbi:MAG: polymer-forming cytoskeletal protein [Lentisphaerae bacterium]|nr:polymer-forming cytoskeletal protein [Lentisphaerota bacterium]